MITNKTTTKYMEFKKARVDELLRNGEYKTRREAGKVAKSEWENDKKQENCEKKEEEPVAQEVKSTVKPEDFTKYKEFKKARVDELIEQLTSTSKRSAGIIAKQEWNSWKKTNKKNGKKNKDENTKKEIKEVEKPKEKKVSEYKLFKNRRVNEIMKENPEMKKRDAGAIAKSEWDKSQNEKKEAKKAEREAKKAEREAKKAEREAKKAEREAKKAEREAKKAEKLAKKEEKIVVEQETTD